MEMTVQLSETILTECVWSSHAYLLQAKLSILPLVSDKLRVPGSQSSAFSVISEAGCFLIDLGLEMSSVLECVCVYVHMRLLF